MDRRLIYAVDVDGTLCTDAPGHQYELAEPKQEVIDIVNMLYDAGHYIKIFTARGQFTGEDRKELTENQLKQWGVKYHELCFKTAAHVYIDDRAIHPDQLERFFNG